jgi:hypothetical protein
MPKVKGKTTIPRNWKCVDCVVKSVEEWSGEEVLDLNEKLEKLYTKKHGPCDSGALRDLKDIIKDNCSYEVSLHSMRCSMTLSQLIRLICGF